MFTKKERNNVGDFWNILYIAGIIETNVMFKLSCLIVLAYITKGAT